MGQAVTHGRIKPTESLGEQNTQLSVLVRAKWGAAFCAGKGCSSEFLFGACSIAPVLKAFQVETIGPDHFWPIQFSFTPNPTKVKAFVESQVS